MKINEKFGIAFLCIIYLFVVAFLMKQFVIETTDPIYSILEKAVHFLFIIRLTNIDLKLNYKSLLKFIDFIFSVIL